MVNWLLDEPAKTSEVSRRRPAQRRKLNNSANIVSNPVKRVQKMINGKMVSLRVRRVVKDRHPQFN